MTSKRLLVDGEWVNVQEPTVHELQSVLDGCANWMWTVRLREVEAWITHQQRERQTHTLNDQRFLRSLRIGPWDTPA